MSDRLLSHVPRGLKSALMSPPKHGSGVHRWLYAMSCRLHRFLEPEEIVLVLNEAVANCGRRVPGREVRDAVYNSVQFTELNPRSQGVIPLPRKDTAWPAINSRLREQIIADCPFGIVDMEDQSPILVGQQSPDAEWFIDQLFPGNPLLCMGPTAPKATVAPREALRGRIGGLSLMVPSPMTNYRGHRKCDGKETSRCLENTGPRRFLITECDSGSLDQQSAIIHHLAQFAPLTAVVWSGGKSLHAWWKCGGKADEVTRGFMRYAVSLGADAATWCRVQLIRIPGGMRYDTSKRQRVCYFDQAILTDEEVAV